jgi:hypothetical protein
VDFGRSDTVDTLTYDANGNLTYDGNQTYTYDAWNRLMTASHARRDGSAPLTRHWEAGEMTGAQIDSSQFR